MSESKEEITDLKTEEKEEKEDNDISAPLTSTTLTPIILDNGSGILKSGLSTSSSPYCLQSLVGTPKHLRVMLSSNLTSKYFGNLAYKYRGLCKLSYPIKNGIVSNWNDCIQLWQYLFDNILEISDLSSHPILFTEVPKNAISNRIRITQIYFEYFNIPSIYFISPSVLSLYATGRLNGCILDSGFNVTTCTPIIDGYSYDSAITRMNIGGENITKYLRRILTLYGDYNFHTTSELQTIRIIKEKECILSSIGIDNILNPQYNLYGIMGNNYTGGGGVINSVGGGSSSHSNLLGSSNLLSSKLSSLSGKLGSSFQTLGLTSSKNKSLNSLTNSSDDNSPQYTLPDGTILNIGNTHERCGEILFNPSLCGENNVDYRGIQYLILNCIKKCDIKLRNKLYDSIYLTGGNCNIKNFQKRLLYELKKNISKNNNNNKKKFKKY
eukprot:483874_1